MTIFFGTITCTTSIKQKDKKLSLFPYSSIVTDLQTNIMVINLTAKSNKFWPYFIYMRTLKNLPCKACLWCCITLQSNTGAISPIWVTVINTKDNFFSLLFSHNLEKLLAPYVLIFNILWY